MHLCNLPDEILLPIACRACNEPDRPAALPLRDKLPLLAVCRRLRELALPVVYDTVHYTVHSRDYDPVYDLVYFSDPDSPQYTKMYSNLGLVSSVGYAHLVKRVNVEIHSETDPFRHLDKMVRRMRAAREQWDAVRTLFIVVDGSPARHMDWDAIARNAQETAAALTAMFPRVQRLSFGTQAYQPATDRFASCVAAHYAAQLRTLRSDRVIATPPEAVFRGLTAATIIRSIRGDYRLPRIDPAELRRLELEGWPDDHSWAAFSADGDESRDIQFPRLRVLCLSSHQKPTTSWTDESKRKGRLHFPALKVLKVKCGDCVPRVLEHGVFPARIDRVVVEARPSTLLDIADMALPNSRSFQLYPWRGFGDDPPVTAAIQRILDRARSCDEVVLKAGDRCQLNKPEIFASTPVTRLEVSTYINLDTMVALIRRLPRLSSLDIRRVDAPRIRSDVSVPEPGADRLVEPISSTLKSVCAAFDCDRKNPEPAVLTLKYLLLALPSLSGISAYDIPGDTMDGFVEDYADQYPHLARLRINFHKRRC